MKKRWSLGFSLIEISIVLGIIGVIAVVALPSLSAFRRENAIYSETKKFTAAIAFMRQLAIEEGVPYDMYLCKDENKYSIRKAATAATILKEWNFENGFSFDEDKSSNLRTDGNYKFFQIYGESGLLDLSVDTTVSLKYGTANNINIKIKTTGEMEIEW